MTNPPNESLSPAGSRAYSEQVAAVEDRLVCQFGHRGRIRFSVGEQGFQQVPFAATINGDPYDILATVSVGNSLENRKAQYSAAAAIEGARGTYALVRKPYSNEPAQVISLKPEEVATGQCNIDVQAEAAAGIGRIAEVPDGGSVRQEVALTDGQFDTSVTPVEIGMNGGEAWVQARPGAYMFTVAGQ